VCGPTNLIKRWPFGAARHGQRLVSREAAHPTVAGTSFAPRPGASPEGFAVMQLPSSPRPLRSRRRYPRLEVLGLVEGQRIPLDTHLTVRDLSVGGFSAESAVPFPPGSKHHFLFTTALGEEVVLSATSIHCRLATADANGHFTYITGFEFHSSEATDRSIASLVDTLAAVLEG
jgi:hypothetical protein